jgi:hypothetical protein
MRRNLAAAVLTSVVLASVSLIPARASGRDSHKVVRSSLRALRPMASAANAGRATGPSASWVAGAPMPVALGEQGGGVSVANFFWSIGGYDSLFNAHNDTQRYNKRSDAWASGTPIPGAPSPGWADAAFCFDPVASRIHVVNGSDGTFLYAAHQVYDPSTDTWSNSAVPSIPGDGNYYSQDSGCAFIGGKMYLFGGYGRTDSGPTSTADLQELTWVYTPSTDRWADTGKVMTGSAYLWSAYTSTSTKVYVAGGEDISLVQHNDTQTFTPAGGWVAGPGLPRGLGGAGAGTVAGRIIVWGGRTRAGTMNTRTYACVLPACASWETLTFDTPAAKAYFAWGSGSSVFSAGGFNASFTAQSSSEHLP